MIKHEDGSITYTAKEVEKIQFAVEELNSFAHGGPWTYQDCFENREQDYHDYLVGSHLAGGEPWTEEDEKRYRKDYELDDEDDEDDV